MHQPMLSGVLEGQATDLQIEAEEMLRMRDVLYRIYSDASGRSIEQIGEDCERNCWLDAEGMAEYGLVDRVIERLNSEAS
jgi:ATP-dependent Clp protease protease subunit